MSERREFPPLRREDLDPDPFAQFADWYELASEEVPLADAMTLATIGADGGPDARMVLLKGHGPDGFVFYTNTESAKGRELEASKKAAVLFHWKSQRKQVRVRGLVEAVTYEEAEAYFATRPRGAQIGAWASQQSRPLSCREVLEDAVADVEEGYPNKVPRPNHWSGYRVKPLQIEFWSDGDHRLHDRILFSPETLRGAWPKTRLYP